jgi:hypothetical protein
MESWQTDPSKKNYGSDPFIQEMLLRDRYSVKGRLADGDKPVLMESSYITWYVSPLAEAWAENQSQLQNWAQDTKDKVKRRDAALLSRFLMFHAYLQGHPSLFGLSPQVEKRIEAQLSDENGNIYDALEVRAGNDQGVLPDALPTLTLLFPATDSQTGAGLVETRKWLHLVLLIDGSRYFFDFPVQGG